MVKSSIQPIDSKKFLQYKIDSDLGPIYLVASEQGVAGVYFEKQNYPEIKKLGTFLSQQNKIETYLQQASIQLKEYLAGERKKFNLTLDLEGTDFQKKVWRALSQIPYGKTVSYKDIAVKIDHPQAVRAVGSANGKNPICIVIPCHRVINSNGNLGGYSGGIKYKKQLLKIEGL